VTIGRLNAETVLEGREKIGAPGGNRTPDPRLRSTPADLGACAKFITCRRDFAPVLARGG